MQRGPRHRQEQLILLNPRHGRARPQVSPAAPGATGTAVPRVGNESRGRGARGWPRTAALCRGAPRSLRSGPGPCAGTPGLRAGQKRLRVFAQVRRLLCRKVERARVRSPRRRVGAGSAGPGGEGDRAAGPPPGTHTARRPPPRLSGTSEAPSAAALTHRWASSAMPSRSSVLLCVTPGTRRGSTCSHSRSRPARCATGGPASTRWVASRPHHCARASPPRPLPSPPPLAPSRPPGPSPPPPSPVPLCLAPARALSLGRGTVGQLGTGKGPLQSEGGMGTPGF